MECGCRGRMKWHMKDTRKRYIKLKGQCGLQKGVQMKGGVGR